MALVCHSMTMTRRISLSDLPIYGLEGEIRGVKPAREGGLSSMLTVHTSVVSSSPLSLRRGEASVRYSLYKGVENVQLERTKIPPPPSIKLAPMCLSKHEYVTESMYPYVNVLFLAVALYCTKMQLAK